MTMARRRRRLWGEMRTRRIVLRCLRLLGLLTL